MSLDELLIHYESQLRVGIFFSIIFIMASWEYLLPRRKPSISKPKRWLNNFGLIFFNTALLRFIFPVTAVSVAIYCEKNTIGLLHFTNLPIWVSILFAIIALDCLIYFQHRLFHKVPVLWRLHKVHHADQDIDLSTGGRFHTIEILLSMLIKCTFICIIGAPAIATILFEIILNSTSMFNHSNVAIPAKADKFIRRFIVTPDMHRVHHSIINKEMNSNFGFNLSIWDRVFGSYTPQPMEGHDNMIIGLTNYPNWETSGKLTQMLVMPFHNQSRD